MEYKGQTGKVIARSIEGGRKKTKNNLNYTVELDGKAFNGKEVVFEESLIDYPKETTAAVAVAGRPGNQKSSSNKETSNMRLGSNSDDNDSDAYAASQGSLDTDQASEVGEGEASDAAISSEDIIGEDNDNDSCQNCAFIFLTVVFY